MIGKIYISGLIGSFGDEVGVELIDVISQVKKQPDATSFQVFINSEGGVVDTGFDIYNYLKSLGLPITTVGNGLVASIATVIFMAGSKRIIAPNTQFMIHLPMGGIEMATADEMEEYAKGTREVENKLISFYSKELNLGKEALTPLLKKESWLNTEQLKDLGFVTTETEIKIAARAILKNKPKTITKMSKTNKFQALLNALKAITKEEVNKVVFSAEEKEINFPELGEDDAITVGAKATYDGKPAAGEIVGQDGNIYVFESGVLKEVKKPNSEEEMSDEDMLDALTATLEFVNELSNEVETVKTEVTGLKTENTDLKTKLDTATKTIAKLKGNSNSPEQEKKEKGVKEEKVSSMVAQWRENKKNKKNK